MGPSAEEEANFLAQERGAEVDAPAAIKTAPAKPEEDNAPLPPMEDLVERIPVAARELIEELFRARFVTVKRIPKSALKS